MKFLVNCNSPSSCKFLTLIVDIERLVKESGGFCQIACDEEGKASLAKRVREYYLRLKSNSFVHYEK